MGGGRFARRVQRVLARHADRTPRGRADHSIHGESVPRLQPAYRGLGFGTEGPVDRQVQRALKARDRVSGSWGGRARAGLFGGAASDFAAGLRFSFWRGAGRGGEGFCAVHPDRVPCGLTDDAVGAQTVPFLQANHRGLGFGAECSVHRKVQRGLEATHGVAGGGRFAFAAAGGFASAISAHAAGNRGRFRSSAGGSRGDCGSRGTGARRRGRGQ